MIDIVSLIQKYLLSWQSFAIYVILFLVYIIFKMAVKKAAAIFVFGFTRSPT